MSNPACDDLSPGDFRLVRGLFDELADLPPAERQARIEAVDPGLRPALLGLLRNASELSASFLEPPVGRIGDDDAPLWAPGLVIGGRFRITAHLGNGGMGQVYAADDLRLGEPVAVKTLRRSLTSNPNAVARLRNEVRRARRIAHPNVCRVYEFFELSEPPSACFITMELLQGRTLQAALSAGVRYSPAAALLLLRQIAEALESCHIAGIVHRDLKPGNVFLPGPVEDRAVVMDFGICGDHRNGDQSALGIAGTPAYMAPEQFAGAPASPRTDIYSLGVLAYELVTGRQLIAASSPHAAALGESSAGGHGPLPAAWRTHILRCVERDPERRFARPLDFVEALAGPSRQSRRAVLALAATGVTLLAGGAWEVRRRKSPALTRTVGVMPFELSGPGEPFVPAGLTDFLHEHLRRQPELGVVGRATMARFQGKEASLAELGREAGADLLVRGFVSQLTGDVAVSVQVVKPADGALLWSRAYRRPKENLAGAARDIAADVAAAVLERSGDPMPTLPAASPEAYDLYLRGRYHFNRRDPGDLESAIALFEKSIEADHRFASAHSALSDALCALADVGHTSVRAALDRAHRAAKDAVGLAPGDGHAHASLALAVSFREADWRTAETHFLRAMQLAPRDATIHQWYSALLLKMGRFDECLEQARQAVQLDPLSLAANVNAANMALFAARYPEAENLFLRVQRLAPEFWFVHEALGETYARLGKREEALREAGLALELGRTRGRALAWAANVRAILGDRTGALQLLAELTAPAAAHRFQPFHVARAYAQLGMADDALRWLERGLAEHDIGLQIVPIHRSFDPIRSDPRFIAILGRLPIPH